MKRFILFAQACIFSVIALPISLSAQDIDRAFPNYVVIGAFAHEKNAITFTDEAKHNNYPARFEMNPNRNLYYVYVMTTGDREYARAEALRLRVETKYFDTWVYSGVFGNIDVATIDGHEQVDFNPVTGQRLDDIDADKKQESTNATRFAPRGTSNQQHATTDGSTTPAPTDYGSVQRNIARPTSNSTAKAEQIQSDRSSRNTQVSPRQADATANTNLPSKSWGDASVMQSQQSPGTSQNKSEILNPFDEGNDSAEVDGGNTTEQVVNIPPPVRQSTEPLSSEEVVGKNFYFHLYRADNLKTVPGEVDAIDFEKSRKMGTYPANEGVKVAMAGGKMKHISFVCQVFGYRKQQHEFDPESPSEQLYLDDKANLVIPFELVRLQKGDIAIMYNVFFFKDAAVMRPESRYEVNNLLDLLVENPSYKIMIHGHTNGNASGKIIRMDKPGNFYSLAGTKQGFGSAKNLSEERAIVIREFLISSGISADRMQVKAWGGKKPIHDKHSARAHENVRVEIEILSQ